MTSTQDIVLRLLRNSICGTDIDIPSNVDWMYVIGAATNYGVLGVCYDAIEKLPPDQRPDIDSLMEWAGQTAYQEKNYEHSWEIACALDKLWASAGIDATVIKGRSLSKYYTNPNHRYSCDLDIFIPSGEWEKACCLLKEKGVALEFEIYKEVEFTIDGVYVECHRFITPVRGNDTLIEFEKYLRNILISGKKEYFDGTHLVNPPLLFNALLYVEHALWDLLHGKLTLKHVVDWMVLRKLIYSSESGVSERFMSASNEFRFERFLSLINEIADVIEGKTKLEQLSSSYQRVFNEMFQESTGHAGKSSWTERRIAMFFDIIKSGWKYRKFGYCSMPSFLFHSLWTHWFDKEVGL